MSRPRVSIHNLDQELNTGGQELQANVLNLAGEDARVTGGEQGGKERGLQPASSSNAMVALENLERWIGLP